MTGASFMAGREAYVGTHMRCTLIFWRSPSSMWTAPGLSDSNIAGRTRTNTRTRSAEQESVSARHPGNKHELERISGFALCGQPVYQGGTSIWESHNSSANRERRITDATYRATRPAINTSTNNLVAVALMRSVSARLEVVL
jgi:hypothetical protein